MEILDAVDLVEAKKRRLKYRIAEAERRLGQAKDEVAGRERSLEADGARLEERQESFERTRVETAEREADLARRETALQSVEELARRETAVEVREAESAAREERLQALEEKLGRQRRDLDSQRISVDARLQALGRLHRQTAMELEAVVDELNGARWWRPRSEETIKRLRLVSDRLAKGQ